MTCLVAIQTNEGNQVFQFPNKQKAKKFIKSLPKEINWLVSEEFSSKKGAWKV